MSRGDVWLSRALIMFDLALNLSIAMGTFSYTFSVPFTNMTAIYCYLKLLRFYRATHMHSADYAV